MSKRYEGISGSGFNRRIYALSHWGVNQLMEFAGVHVFGVENVPTEGGALVVANHRTKKDVFVLPSAIPDRPATMVSKEEELRKPILGWYLRKLGAIPVHRGEPTKDEFREMTRIPAAGGIEILLPEGTRDKKRKKTVEHADLNEFKHGVARIARIAGVKTTPAALYGMDRFSGYRGVAFGEAFDPPESRNDELPWLDKIKHSVEELYMALHNGELK